MYSNGQGDRFLPHTLWFVASFTLADIDIYLVALKRALRAFDTFFFNELLDQLNT